MQFAASCMASHRLISNGAVTELWTSLACSRTSRFLQALRSYSNRKLPSARPRRAPASIRKLRQVTGDNNDGSLQTLLLYACTGKQGQALAGLTGRPRDGALDHDVLGVASIYAALGNRDRAIAILEKGLETRSTLAFIFVDPRLDPLRSDPRFHRLLRRANLPS